MPAPEPALYSSPCPLDPTGVSRKHQVLRKGIRCSGGAGAGRIRGIVRREGTKCSNQRFFREIGISGIKIRAVGCGATTRDYLPTRLQQEQRRTDTKAVITYFDNQRRSA